MEDSFKSGSFVVPTEDGNYACPPAKVIQTLPRRGGRAVAGLGLRAGLRAVAGRPRARAADGGRGPAGVAGLVTGLRAAGRGSSCIPE